MCAQVTKQKPKQKRYHEDGKSTSHSEKIDQGKSMLMTLLRSVGDRRSLSEWATDLVKMRIELDQKEACNVLYAELLRLYNENDATWPPLLDPDGVERSAAKGRKDTQCRKICVSHLKEVQFAIGDDSAPPVTTKGAPLRTSSSKADLPSLAAG